MPTPDHSISRPIPRVPWNAMLALSAALVVATVAAWEFACRNRGYERSLEDDPGLWAERRRAVQADSLVVIGSSRALFGVNLDAMEAGFGQRPIQLALVGSSGYPILEDLANDERFRGTVICDITRMTYFGPEVPLFLSPRESLKRYHQGTWSQRVGHFLSLPLNRTFAFLQQNELSLKAFFGGIPVPDRPGTLLPPRLPGFIHTVDAERQGRMRTAVEQPGPRQEDVRGIWMRLFTPPPPPPFVPADTFRAGMKAMVEKRFKGTADAVAKLRARGVKVVFVHFPSVSPLAELEEKHMPRAVFWDGLLKATGAPGVFHADYPELANFDCPEWSHLSASDAVLFTQRLVPHVKSALAAQR